MKNLITLFIICFVTNVYSQDDWDWNFGLPHKQAVMPVSKAPLAVCTRRARVDRTGVLSLDKDNEYVITSGWDMIEAWKTVSKTILDPSCDMNEWYNATVPGTVLTTLVEQGVYPDPYIGLNNLQIPDTLCRMDWWYRVKFDLPVGVNKSEYAWLLFNGINYKAQVWFNGKPVGNIVGAFIRGQFDVGKLLKEKDNVLAVHIFPPNNPGIPHEANMREFGPNGGTLCFDGPTFIASEGWDWMPAMRDRSIGIWQDVRLCLGGAVHIEDTQVITDLPLPDTSSVQITVKTTLYNMDAKAHTTTLSGEIENIRFDKTVSLQPKERVTLVFSPQEFAQLNMKNPRLWWPNGYGEQPLYTLKLSVANADLEQSDIKTVRFGIREMSYELMVDAPRKQGCRLGYSPTDLKTKRPLFSYNHEKLRKLPEVNPDLVIPQLREGVNIADSQLLEDSKSPYLYIKVNGVPIFCKGGNWGMDDAMKRVSRAQLEPYFRLHAEENFNIVRNWLGQSTEEVFYELCDEYGMLVWNDFFMSTGWYNVRPLDDDLFLNNARDIVKRYVNHPSIAVWCCGNETYAPLYLEEGFQNIVAELDGTRHYHGQSRYVNLTPSGPWCYIKDYTEYYRKIATGFDTELGAPSVPTYETLKKFIPVEDLWPRNDVWSYHDAIINGWVGWTEYCDDIDTFGKEPCRNAEEFCERAQVLNYNLHRVLFESWNDKMWEGEAGTSGVFYWMSHPAWYSVIQQTYSWDYKTFGTFYGCKKSCEPAHIQWNLYNQKVQVINASLNSHENLKAGFEVFTVSGKKIHTYSKTVSVSANSKLDAFTMNLPESPEKLLMVRLKLTDSKKRLLSVNDYWCNEKYVNMPAGLNELEATSLKMKVMKVNPANNTIAIAVENTGKKVAPYVEMNVTHEGKSILPVYFSDSYFNLLPGESKIVSVEIPELKEIVGTKMIVAKALNGKVSFQL